MNIYRVLELPCEMFTTNQNDSLLWFEQLRKITQFDLRQKNLEMPTIAITLTASGLLYKNSKPRDDDLIFNVPYSNHSSASELARCLNYLQPTIVERIVQSPTRKPVTSVVINYQNNRPAELTSDSDSMETEEFMPPVHRSQKPDEYFTPASAATLLLPPIEPSSQSQESTDEIVSSRASSTSSSRDPTEVEGDVARRAEEVIASLHADMDADGRCVYTDGFIKKLIGLAKIYEPVTGIPFDMPTTLE